MEIILLYFGSYKRIHVPKNVDIISTIKYMLRLSIANVSRFLGVVILWVCANRANLLARDP